MLNDRKLACDFATKAGVEIFEKFMNENENVLLGRSDENSDPLHPDFLPNIEDFFLYNVDINPVEKFNFLANILSKSVKKKIQTGDEKI